eukprot:2435595-Ditylum_brightwellii.AAC.1
MVLQVHAEGHPGPEALRLPDPSCSNQPASTPYSPTSHGVFMLHKVQRKKIWHRNITVLQGYNHNVNGLKQELKIKRLCQAFWDDNIDFGCLQETWLSDDYQREIKTKSMHGDKLQSRLFFHHGQPIQQNRGSGGVAILLGKNGIQAWKNAGSPDPIRGDLIDGIAQSMGLELHMKDK